jgi:hypothetical protein
MTADEYFECQRRVIGLLLATRRQKGKLVFFHAAAVVIASSALSWSKEPFALMPPFAACTLRFLYSFMIAGERVAEWPSFVLAIFIFKYKIKSN